jgi:hypothetical protein
MDSLYGMTRQLGGLGEILFTIKVNVVSYVTQGLKLLRIIWTGSCSENLKVMDCLENVSGDGWTQVHGLS